MKWNERRDILQEMGTGGEAFITASSWISLVQRKHKPQLCQQLRRIFHIIKRTRSVLLCPKPFLLKHIQSLAVGGFYCPPLKVKVRWCSVLLTEQEDVSEPDWPWAYSAHFDKNKDKGRGPLFLCLIYPLLPSCLSLLLLLSLHCFVLASSVKGTFVCNRKKADNFIRNGVKILQFIISFLFYSPYCQLQWSPDGLVILRLQIWTQVASGRLSVCWLWQLLQQEAAERKTARAFHDVSSEPASLRTHPCWCWAFLFPLCLLGFIIGVSVTAQQQQGAERHKGAPTLQTDTTHKEVMDGLLQVQLTDTFF